MKEKIEKSKLFRIAERIEDDFKSRNEELSLNNISENAGIAYNTVSRFFRKEGYPRIDTAEKIAKALGYNFNELLRDDYNGKDVELSEEQKKYNRMVMEFSEDEVYAIKIIIQRIWSTHHNKQRKPRKKNRRKN